MALDFELLVKGAFVALNIISHVSDPATLVSNYSEFIQTFKDTETEEHLVGRSKVPTEQQQHIGKSIENLL